MTNAAGGHCNHHIHAHCADGFYFTPDCSRNLATLCILRRGCHPQSMRYATSTGGFCVVASTPSPPSATRGLARSSVAGQPSVVSLILRNLLQYVSGACNYWQGRGAAATDARPNMQCCRNTQHVAKARAAMPGQGRRRRAGECEFAARHVDLCMDCSFVLQLANPLAPWPPHAVAGAFGGLLLCRLRRSGQQQRARR